LFPLCSLSAETIIGSDHSPLILSSGDEWRKHNPRFFFKKRWLEHTEFRDKVVLKCRELERLGDPFYDPIDAWNFVSVGLRQFLKGWGSNIGKEARDTKASILAHTQALDM
jgi:hypothetical protein